MRKYRVLSPVTGTTTLDLDLDKRWFISAMMNKTLTRALLELLSTLDLDVDKRGLISAMVNKTLTRAMKSKVKLPTNYSIPTC